MAGRVGRPALPSNVVQLRGNPSKKPMATLLDEFAPDVELPGLPAWVQGEARAEYRRLGKELERYGLVSKIDRGVLVMLATEWGRYVWAEKRIAEVNALDPEGERGLIDRTPNDYRVVSVYEQIRRQSQTMYLKLASEFGLTPASRTRVKPGSPQLHLPGMTPANGDAAQLPSLASFA